MPTAKNVAKVILTGALVAFLIMSAPATAQDFGQIEAPPGTDVWQQESGLGEELPALIFFISQMITLITIVAGIWVVVNVFVAGYLYITGDGKPDAHNKVQNLLTMSVIGLLLIAASYTIGGILGLIFFGDASYILDPSIW